MCRAVVLAVAAVAATGGLPSESAASEAAVTAAGAYPFPLPGITAPPESPPKALLWCQGQKLLGVVVPDDRSRDCGAAPQKRPWAILLQDGRCGADGGTVSFGFLLSRKTWVVESAARVPVEHTVWLLHRFEGSVKDEGLRGVLVQVDISHPGHAFQRKTVEIPALPEEQASFPDEGAWRGGVSQRFCLAAEGP